MTYFDFSHKTKSKITPQEDSTMDRKSPSLDDIGPNQAQRKTLDSDIEALEEVTSKFVGTIHRLGPMVDRIDPEDGVAHPILEDCTTPAQPGYHARLKTLLDELQEIYNITGSEIDRLDRLV